MRVKITQGDDCLWYHNVIGAQLQVVEHPEYHELYFTVENVTEALGIFKSDCEVIEGGIIPLPADYVSIEDVFVVGTNGKRYRLVEETEPTPAPKPTVFNTYEDCLFRVDPRYYLSTLNEICKCNGPMYKGDVRDYNMFPTEKNGRQIQAAIKLFVIQHALNGGPYIPTKDCTPAYVYFDNSRLKSFLVTNKISVFAHNPYAFKTLELAMKAIEIGEDIWLEYFGVER